MNKNYLQIDKLTLDNVLPDVFLREPERASGVWRRKIVLERGGRYIIEAASGTGKSSLCAYIYGARIDYQGTISFDTTDARSLTPAKWQKMRREVLAYLPQELDLFPELTALENIRLKNRLTNYYSDSEIMERMASLGIDAHSHRPVGLMSIGQQQRVAIVRALCQPFSFILLDEPVSHLDAINNEIAARMVLAEAEARQAAVIATSVGNKLAMTDYELLTL